MPNLEAMSGLPMALDEAGQIVFGLSVVVNQSKVRRLDELTPVALDPESCRDRQEIAYYMYNGVYLQSDAPRLAGVPMQYDLTLIPARRLNHEFVKTCGHLHTTEPASGLTYAEIYEVLVGTAHFFFQTLDLAGPDATQALYIEALAGDKVIIPPGFDHLTINPGPGPLLFSDVISLDAAGIYERYRASRGAAYLEVAEPAHFIPNPAYRAVPSLRQVTPGDYPALRLTRHEPLYTAFVQTQGEDWAFLADPGRFQAAFPDLTAEFGA